MTESMTSFYRSGRWKRWVIPLYALVTLITCAQGLRHANNNITIFRYSSLHLMAHQPLYDAYRGMYKDYFLYHPSFSVLFMPFAFLPEAVALVAWLIFSTVVFIKAVSLLPGISTSAKKIILLLVLPELANNQQYAQTNILLAALMLLAFVYFEKNRLSRAAFFTILAFCIKGYGGIIGLLFLLYPGKLKFAAWAFVWGLLICSLPLLFVPLSETLTLYTDWLKMISSDEIKESLSLIGIFGKTAGAERYISLSGLLLLLSSFAIALRNPAILTDIVFRRLVCCYLFIWVVLFNRAAESPTYLLAAASIACWLFTGNSENKKKWFVSLLLLTVYLLPSDLFPAIIHRIFTQYNLKVYPFTLYFLFLQFQLWNYLQSKLIARDSISL